MKPDAGSAVAVFLVVCFAFGAMLGLIGLGIGLVFLTASQGIGIGIITFGCGAFYGAAIGGKRIMRLIMRTMMEIAPESKPE